MNFLSQENAVAERFVPGLLAEVNAIPFSEKESNGKPALDAFRRLKGASLIVPKELGGMGATPVEAIRFQRALAAVAPSAALASNMHHFTVSLLADFANDSPTIRYLLKSSVQNGWLLASGFAEGASSTSTLTPTMTAEPGGAGYTLNGSKKPCSLAYSMDIFTASVRIESPGGDRFGIAIIPAKTAGMSVKPFWSTPVLAGAESEEVVLKDVAVSQQNMFLPGDQLDYAAVQAKSFIWFQLLVSSCYLGVGSALLAHLIQAKKGTPEGRVEIASQLEAAMAALEGVACGFQIHENKETLVTRALFTRYAVANALVRATAQAAELLGGMAYMKSEYVSYLMSAVRCLAYHPPSRLAVSGSLDKYLAGERFAFV